MTNKDRLLTDEQIAVTLDNASTEAGLVWISSLGGKKIREILIKAQDCKTRQQTLQEVGERLLDIYDTSPDKEKAFSDAIEKLVDGVMPGER